jgi:uncharacterized protein
VELHLLEPIFSICKLRDLSAADCSPEFCFLSKTDEEISLVCPSGTVPANAIERSDGWKGFRIQGVLDFSLVGILANVATVLAQRQISIFAVSTYNTDYIFTKAEYFADALQALAAAGYRSAG